MTIRPEGYFEMNIKGKSAQEIRFKILVKQYDDLSKLINGQQMFALSPDEALRFQDILNLLGERGYLGCAKLNHSYAYKILGPLTDFRQWLSTQEKEEQRLSRREWRIAIISASIGGIIGLLPTIFSFLQSIVS